MTALTGAARYEKGRALGEGTYGVVFRATDKLTGRVVAIKKIRLGDIKEGVNVTALREIKMLKEIKDPHIIDMVNVYPHKRNLHLVFEFMETDLEAVIKNTHTVLSQADIKSYMQMALKAVAVCHKKWVLHRDLKPNNFLVASNGLLKLADFGLARIFGSPDRRFTPQVFACWYRAPELLFGSKQYGPAVDMWAMGCILAELVLRRPFLPGVSDIDQLGKIFQAFGTPRESDWPDMTSLPDYVEFNYVPRPPLKSHFPTASDACLDLLSKMFAYDPNRRITAQQALEHRYFTTGPPPTRPDQLPKPAARPEAGEKLLQDSPMVLSPSSKARRLSFPPPDTGTSGRGPKDGQPEGGAAGPMGSAGPMSLDIPRGVGSRPTIDSNEKSYLRKRKLEMDKAFDEERP